MRRTDPWRESECYHSGITGTPGFIVGTELVPGALDVKGLKELIAQAGTRP